VDARPSEGEDEQGRTEIKLGTLHEETSHSNKDTEKREAAPPPMTQKIAKLLPLP
jgi:hypothetical protein